MAGSTIAPLILDFCYFQQPKGLMSDERRLTTTSISIPNALLQAAKVKAAQSFRTFSQYVSFLIDQDLSRERSVKTWPSLKDSLDKKASGGS